MSLCSRSNVLYNYECNKKDSCPDSTYDGQSSKNLYTRSLGHSYKYEKKHKDSFLTLHQEKAHNNEDENFKLSVTRFYGQDRLSCEIAEAVILRTRTGDVCNLKSEWHDPPLVQVTRRVQRGLWLALGHSCFLTFCLNLVFLSPIMAQIPPSSNHICILMNRTGVETCWVSNKFKI